MNNIIAFVPCRKGSQRVKNKNVRDFADIHGGLTRIKITQLLKVKEIKTIIISTNDEEVKAIAKSFNNNKIIIDDRPDYLADSSTSTDELIKYIPKIIKSGLVLWTHVTSPLINEKIYSEAIKKYFENINIHDSLMSVTKLQKFIWGQNNPVSYDKLKEKWPRTQTIKPLYEVNSAIFIADIKIYKTMNDRIGKTPLLFETSEKLSFDIDWEDDFEIAEILWDKYGKL